MSYVSLRWRVEADANCDFGPASEKRLLIEDDSQQGLGQTEFDTKIPDLALYVKNVNTGDVVYDLALGPAGGLTHSGDKGCVEVPETKFPGGVNNVTETVTGSYTTARTFQVWWHGREVQRCHCFHFGCGDINLDTTRFRISNTGANNILANNTTILPGAFLDIDFCSSTPTGTAWDNINYPAYTGGLAIEVKAQPPGGGTVTIPPGVPPTTPPVSGPCPTVTGAPPP